MRDTHLPILARSIPIPHPLGPFILRERLDHPVRSRLVAGAVLLGLVTPLMVAGFLQPDPAGLGTHRQLGYPACGVLVVTGYPCPTCGMTTAFAHTVRGEWMAAVVAQPMGFLLAIASVVGVIATAVTIGSGRGFAVNWYRISPRKMAVAIVLLFVAAWAYKIRIVAGAG